jgi:hypothetical protein
MQRAYYLLTSSQILDRLTDPSRALGGADYSANVRAAAALSAWKGFKRSPLIGEGVAATIDWDFQTSTHNIYLRDIAEYGILGVLIFPALIFMLFRRMRKHSRNATLALVIALLVSGLFSHNLLDEWDMIVVFAIAFALTSDDHVYALGDGVATSRGMRRKDTSPSTRHETT